MSLLVLVPNHSESWLKPVGEKGKVGEVSAKTLPVGLSNDALVQVDKKNEALLGILNEWDG